MRVILAILAAGAAAALAACTQNPVAQQADVDTRFDPVRSDSMLAVNFAPGERGLDSGQVA